MTSKPRDSEIPPLGLISLPFVIIYISARAGWETKNVKCYFCIFLKFKVKQDRTYALYICKKAPILLQSM